MRSKTQANFRWRYQPNNELDKALLSFIKQHPALSMTEVMLTALRAFWLPMAIAHSPSHSQATKQQIARGCVDALLRQADSLCVAVGLELPQRGQIVSAPLVAEAHESGETQSDAPLTASQLAAAAGGGDFNDSGLARW